MRLQKSKIPPAPRRAEPANQLRHLQNRRTINGNVTCSAWSAPQWQLAESCWFKSRAGCELLDRTLRLMAEAVHRYQGTVNQVLGDG